MDVLQQSCLIRFQPLDFAGYGIGVETGLFGAKGRFAEAITTVRQRKRCLRLPGLERVAMFQLFKQGGELRNIAGAQLFAGFDEMSRATGALGIQSGPLD